ncbi:MAG: hypothetical protein BMS9Abin25_0940 [Gammaproteobacteria bacterium]|nr:MAG: hypothetical protein BMS9Abin25_0940 [Gammaproteobacteria bacterium]
MEKTVKDVVTPQTAGHNKKDASRRKALKAIAAVSGGVAVTKWVKPVVESVVLPAHAQATGTIFSMTCVPTPPNGTNLFSPFTASAVVTITPNPGASQTVIVEGFCNGTGPAATDTGLTDAGGQVSFTGNVDFCSVGQNAVVRFSYMGASTECNWNLAVP